MKVSRILLIVLLITLVAGAGLVVWQRYDKAKSEKDNLALLRQTEGVEKESVTIGVSRSLWDPLYPQNQREISSLDFNTSIFQTLITFDKENKILPVLAKKWDNPDSLTWKFYINPDAKFSNGDSVTAEDVKFTYDYLLSHKELETTSNLPQIASINIIDSLTLEIKTKSPNPLLLNNLAIGFLILSKSDVETNGLVNNIGSGPYLAQEVNGKESIKLVRNEGYWQTKPKVKTITYKVIAKEKDRVDALLNKTIDFTSYGYADPELTNKVEQAAKDGQIQARKVLDSTIYFLGFNTVIDKSPYINTPKNPLKDLRVRQAIYKAINIEEVVKSNPFEGMPSSQLVSQGIFGYYPSIVRPEYDLVGAKKLMKEAGYENGFEMTLDYTQGPGVEEILQPLTSELASVGIKVKLNGIDPEKFFPKIMSSDTAFFTAGWSADAMDAGEVFLGLVRTPEDPSGSVPALYSRKDIDQLIDEASQTMDQKTRQQKLQQIMKLVMDDVAKIPLYQIYMKWGISNDLLWSPRLDGRIRPYEIAGKAN